MQLIAVTLGVHPADGNMLMGVATEHWTTDAFDKEIVRILLSSEWASRPWSRGDCSMLAGLVWGRLGQGQLLHCKCTHSNVMWQQVTKDK